MRHIQVKRVASILDCTKEHIYHLIRVGHLSAIKLGPRALRVSEKSLKDFISEREVPTTEFLNVPDD
jgi:excisionase family DNA binding protein